MSVCGKNFNVTVFSDIINMINFKLSVTVIVFEGQILAQNFSTKFYVLI